MLLVKTLTLVFASTIAAFPHTKMIRKLAVDNLENIEGLASRNLENNGRIDNSVSARADTQTIKDIKDIIKEFNKIVVATKAYKDTSSSKALTHAIQYAIEDMSEFAKDIKKRKQSSIESAEENVIIKLFGGDKGQFLYECKAFRQAIADREHLIKGAYRKRLHDELVPRLVTEMKKAGLALYRAIKDKHFEDNFHGGHGGVGSCLNAALGAVKGVEKYLRGNRP